MKNYIIIIQITKSIDIHLLIPNVEQNTFTLYPLDRTGPSRHYPDFMETLINIELKPDRFTLVPTSATTVDEVLKSHPELFI